jgi:hypothetical protein
MLSLVAIGLMVIVVVVGFAIPIIASCYVPSDY